MGYIKAAEHADEAANLADRAAMMQNRIEHDGPFELLAFAVQELSKAVAELARTEHRKG